MTLLRILVFLGAVFALAAGVSVAAILLGDPVAGHILKAALLGVTIVIAAFLCGCVWWALSGDWP